MGVTRKYRVDGGRTKGNNQGNKGVSARRGSLVEIKTSKNKELILSRRNSCIEIVLRTFDIIWEDNNSGHHRSESSDGEGYCCSLLTVLQL